MLQLMLWGLMLPSLLSTFTPSTSSGQLLPPRSRIGDEVGAHAAVRPPIYMVQVRKPAHLLSAGPEEVEEWHRSFLPSPTLDSGEPRMVISYKTVMSGFAARLTAEQVKAMETMEGFVRAQLDEELIPQTTYSPDFLGLRPDVWDAANRGKGAIIGVIDSGIDYNHMSFAGNEILCPPPEGWKGSCYFERRPACNDKILGATYLRMFSPTDNGGHGSHVAGIAAGLPYPLTSIRADEFGTASGAAPDAYLSIYRASSTCELLWSIERAIEDGVHIISISMSTPVRQLSPGLYANVIAKGALEAVRRGILVVCAACNGGPSPGTVCNDAPWIMTVGASTMGRALNYVLRLGNGQEIQGESVSVEKMSKKGLVFPGANDEEDARLCRNLEAAVNVAGKVVMCYTGDITSAKKAEVVKDAGGVAMILTNTQRRGSIVAEVPGDVGIPVVAVNYADGELLINYARNPEAIVDLRPEAISFDAGPFPAVPSFSGRGPSRDNGGILKPDILGPGVNILSAAAQGEFVLKSGTSMATPHLSGIAAILKLYLSKETGIGWNPAIVRSAIMTTAVSSNNEDDPITDETGDRASLFAIGAGHVHPAAAMDPGLVYDIPVVDYVRYLCGLGYGDEEMFAMVDRTFNCNSPRLRLDPEQLNYPSIMVTLDVRPTSKSKSKTISRTLMSVVSKPSKYTAELSLRTQRRMAVRVSPETLQFSGLSDNRSFDVVFSLCGQIPHEDFDVEGHLRWVSDDKKHTVSSPFLVRVLIKQASQDRLPA
ncbi:hypothetical protein Taro_003377 [Colocasia esculenta]|uniref:Uncharacterized protein n=1 Tax=Colocasia esculenta TaxID=4460 RepID=A0A843TJM4_COLES|nr:hypothetical protein [Colocasia esculenta]